MSQPAQQQNATPAPVPSRFKEETVDQVLTNINKLQEAGDLKLPPDYSAENAVRSAFLMMQEVKAKKGPNEYVPALEHCTKSSVANAMLDMVLQGLSPVKKQCYFIAYGNRLQLSRSYLGTLAVARRVAGVAEVVANVVYEGEEFEFEINGDTGRKRVIKHTQSLDSIDNSKIKGVYATVIMQDGTRHVEIMTLQQVKQAWAQGQSKGNSDAHKNFPEEMAKKSCINRALKVLIGGTDDGALYDDDDVPADTVAASVQQTIKSNSNGTTISMSKTPAPKQESAKSERTYIQEEPVIDPEANSSTDENPPY